jgi:uncharacterized small protein (DUF1192 family)
MTEDAVAKTVADDLAETFKPVPLHKHTQINGKEARPSEIRPGEDPHSKWLRFGEQLHDQQVKMVAELDRRYQALQDEIVAKMRERDAVMIDRAIEHSRLASYRAKLGYGR